VLNTGARRRFAAKIALDDWRREMRDGKLPFGEPGSLVGVPL
jgi:hypothetical protein